VEEAAAARTQGLGLTLLLIRHARAGEREEWTGDDRLRPLDEHGWSQAERLVELLAPYEIERILSSPYDRCVQTVEPLGRSREVSIEPREELDEEQQDVEGAALVRSLASEPVAVSCHGGLSDVLVGQRQKKGETIVLDVQDDRLVVTRRLSP
jgi:8-oxo-dGTP diphosphatase